MIVSFWRREEYKLVNDNDYSKQWKVRKWRTKQEKLGAASSLNCQTSSVDLKLHTSSHCMKRLEPALTSTPVPHQVAVDILDVGVDGGPAGDAAGGHIRVGLRVNILEAFPRHTRAELWKSKVKCLEMLFPYNSEDINITNWPSSICIHWLHQF